MKNQRRTTAGSRESIERALTHHLNRGGVVGFTAPGAAGHPSKWVVTLNGLGADYFTDAQAKALCLGLAAADRAAQDRVLREIGRALGPELLRYTDTRKLRPIAAGGGPRDPFESAVVYCPLCHCTKSGYGRVPNQIGEACSNSTCICHDDEWNT